MENVAGPGKHSIQADEMCRFFMKNIMIVRKAFNNISIRWRLLAQRLRNLAYYEKLPAGIFITCILKIITSPKGKLFSIDVKKNQG